MPGIAAQLYTLREYLRTPAEIASTLKRVRQIGYRAVQVSGMGPIDPAELARILEGEGLECCATHVSLDALRGQQARLLDDHALWRCRYTAIGGYAFDRRHPESQWADFAREFSALADAYLGRGLRLGYHNHSHEFVPTVDGTRPMDVLLERCSGSVWFEVDTYWVQYGGGDPAAWIGLCAGRVPVVHLKDMSVRFNTDNKVVPVMAEVGEGNLNWSAVFDACEKAGVEYYVIEQDVCERDPFESLAVSLRNTESILADRKESGRRESDTRGSRRGR